MVESSFSTRPLNSYGSGSSYLGMGSPNRSLEYNLSSPIRLSSPALSAAGQNQALRSALSSVQKRVKETECQLRASEDAQRNLEV